MIKYFFAVLVLALILMQSSCTDEKEADRILKANGFTDIQFTGYEWLACSEQDTFSTGFTAKSPNGTTISGAVCSGLLFKNSTIRFK